MPRCDVETKWDLPVLALGMSTHAQGLRFRRVRRYLADTGSDDVAFSKSGQDRHAEVMISELNSWPAFPLADATPAVLPLPAYGPRPK